VRKGDLRREKILDAAEELFFQRGYENTSVQDILDALRMSKGGFYHHFDAKGSVLRAICERRMRYSMDKAIAEMRGTFAGPCDRMNRLLSLASLMEREEPRFLGMLMNLRMCEEDAAVRYGIEYTMMDTLVPMAEKIVEAGIEDGVFHTRFPEAVGRMLLMLSRQLDAEIFRQLSKEGGGPDDAIGLVEMVDAYRNTAEVMLGAPYGSLNMVNVGAILENIRAAQAAASTYQKKREEIRYEI